MVCQWGPKIHFSQLFLLLKIFGEELGGDFTSGYGYLSDTEEQGGKNDWKELSWYLSDTEDQGGRTYKKISEQRGARWLKMIYTISLMLNFNEIFRVKISEKKCIPSVLNLWQYCFQVWYIKIWKKKSFKINLNFSLGRLWKPPQQSLWHGIRLGCAAESGRLWILMLSLMF